MSAPVDVAVAVLIRPDGAALLAQRPARKVYSGYWEFPGGKIEPGEPVAEALRREVREELGIEIERAYPWITRVFSYPHAKVRLHFYRVYAWRGEPRAIEHQAIAWQRPDAIELDPLLPANGPVIRSRMLRSRAKSAPTACISPPSNCAAPRPVPISRGAAPRATRARNCAGPRPSGWIL